MLCLSRKSGQKILIGDDIVVTVIRIGPNIVRVGVEAPDGILILRDELVRTGDPPRARPNQNHDTPNVTEL